MNLILALLPLLGVAGVQEDYAALEKLSSKMNESRNAETFREFNEATKKFVETYCTGTLSDEVIGLLAKSASDPWLGRLLATYVERSLEVEDLSGFISACDRLQEAGLSEEGRGRLLQPWVIALFAVGLVDDAKELAAEEAEARGADGLDMLDMLAAIRAAEGDLAGARALYAAYAEKYGTDDDRASYRYKTKAELIGKAAPDITIATWLGPKGEKAKGWKGLESLRGETVVLDFWQTWCPPCRAVMPSLSELQQKMAGQKFRIIGVCRDDGRPGFDWAKQERVEAADIGGEKYVPHVQKFMKDMGLAYWVGVAPDASNSEKYGVRGIPTLVVINPEGKVAWLTIGASPGVERLLEVLAKKLSKSA
ncbi:MAG: TlpA disulfide reductase family protein [Planctomycetota bacterium]